LASEVVGERIEPVIGESQLGKDSVTVACPFPENKDFYNKLKSFKLVKILQSEKHLA
jgi:hypothetical protein